MGGEDNAATVFRRDGGETRLACAPKPEIARRLAGLIADALSSGGAAA
jgi:hypothetical protein